MARRTTISGAAVRARANYPYELSRPAEYKAPDSAFHTAKEVVRYRYRYRPSGGVNFIERLAHGESHNKFRTVQESADEVAEAIVFLAPDHSSLVRKVNSPSTAWQCHFASAWR